MRIIETPVFTKQINRLLDEDTYKQFKEYLVCNPLKGKLIKGGGGIRDDLRTRALVYQRQHRNQGRIGTEQTADFAEQFLLFINSGAGDGFQIISQILHDDPRGLAV